MTSLLDRTTESPLPQQPTTAGSASADQPARSPARPPARPAAPPAVRRLRLSGVLSRADVPRLEADLEQLVASGAATLEVDLSRVQHMDAAVARLLLRTSWHLGDPARTLVLLHPSRQVRRLLRFYGAGALVAR